MAASCLVAAGDADYPLMAYHFGQAGTLPIGWIPAVYALAMAVDALAALLCGRWFDRAGVRALMVATGLSSLFAPLAFGTSPAAAVAGTVLWGVGMGAQESVMRAAIAGMTPPERRGTAYGVFNLAYGVSWFAGSAVMGVLYSRSIVALWVFSVVAQWLALPLFVRAVRADDRPSRATGLPPQRSS